MKQAFEFLQNELKYNLIKSCSSKFEAMLASPNDITYMIAARYQTDQDNMPNYIRHSLLWAMRVW